MQFNINLHIDIMHFKTIMHSMINRTVEKQIDQYLVDTDNKIFFIWGPRRSGKTTLLEKLSGKLGVPIFNFDMLSDRELFAPTEAALSKIAGEHKSYPD